MDSLMAQYLTSLDIDFGEMWTMTSEQTPNTPLFSIGTAARMLSVSVHTLRMYEREGLIIPFKKPSGHRLYSRGDIERLTCLRRAITEEKVSIEGIRRMLSLIPCWAILKCSERDREVCSAFNGSAAPCWVLERKGEFCVGRECRLCEVYTSHGDCRSIKNSLKVLLSS
jgi:MerR family transcriptional regulator/heat shock protein HspR